jgi:hypothetical protein
MHACCGTHCWELCLRTNSCMSLMCAVGIPLAVALVAVLGHELFLVVQAAKREHSLAASEGRSPEAADLIWSARILQAGIRGLCGTAVLVVSVASVGLLASSVLLSIAALGTYSLSLYLQLLIVLQQHRHHLHQTPSGSSAKAVQSSGSAAAGVSWAETRASMGRAHALAPETLPSWVAGGHLGMPRSALSTCNLPCLPQEGSFATLADSPHGLLASDREGGLDVPATSCSLTEVSREKLAVGELWRITEASG